MPLIFTDVNGKQHRFEDFHKEVVKRLVEENARLNGRVLELESEKDVLQEKLNSARDEVTQLLSVSIDYLDPDGS